MPFFINEDQRISINLSDFANYIIETDMVTFGKDKRSTLINIIIKNFKDEAKSTISTSSEAYRAEIEEILRKKDIVVEKDNHILKALVEHNIKNIIATNYKKGNAFKIRLKNANVDYFINESLDSEYYANSLGAYVNALLEEYTRLSYKKRETIIYKDEFGTINKAINERKVLRITLVWGEIKKIKPFKICEDNQRLYYYLVGYDKESMRSISYRIVDFESVICLQEKAVLTKSDVENLEVDLLNKGVQFMRGESHEIKIRLADEGEKLYKRILHLRPKYTRIEEDNVFVFDCSFKQIEFYFLKFGKEAEIISPLELREKFKNTYLEAYELYKD